jgi:hypothetical protein
VSGGWTRTVEVASVGDDGGARLELLECGGLVDESRGKGGEEGSV